MKRLTLFAALFVFTTAALAQAPPPTRRTIVVRDGKVISNNSGDVLTFFAGKRAYLGVSLTDLSAELREHFGAPRTAGVLIGSVDDDSPAAKAGVRVGDIVLGVDGKDVASSADLRTALREKKDGDSVRLDVLRGRSRQSLVATVTVKEGPRAMAPGDLEDLRKRLDSPEWRARIETLGPNCNDLQSRIKELESRLKDLEKKLQK